MLSRWLQEGGQPALRWVQAGERGVLYARNLARIERYARHPPVHNPVDLVCVCLHMSRITFHDPCAPVLAGKHNTLNLAYRRVAQRCTLATPSHRHHALAVHLWCVSTACHAIEISSPSCDARQPKRCGSLHRICTACHTHTKARLISSHLCTPQGTSCHDFDALRLLPCVCFCAGVVLLCRVPEDALERGWPQEAVQGSAGCCACHR